MTTLVFCAVAFLGANSSGPEIGTTVEPFAANLMDGSTFKFAGVESKVVVIAFLGTECPLAKLYGPRLQSLYAEFAPLGVSFIGVNSNAQDSLAEITAYARRHNIRFPLLKDYDHQIADRLKAVRTPEVFVLNRNRQICYWGRIDDQYGVGYTRERPSQHDLKNAIVALLEGKPIPRPVIESVGCYIGRVRKTKADNSVTYCHQISRILQKHCIECHREGEIGPFTLTDYEEIVGWAETIEEVVRTERMPPWHANPKHGSFSNARAMSAEEKQQIYDWVAAGAPYGDKQQLPLPASFVHGWQLARKPDAVFSPSTAFDVPAEGTVDYQYFVVDPGFTKDTWVSGAEVVPGNRSVVHHAIVFVRPPGNVRQEEVGWLAAYVPGQRAITLPMGHAFLIPAGSKLIFQMHYTPTGSSQSDQTKVGLVFADQQQISHRVMTMVALNRQFEIPPHAENHQVTAHLNRIPAAASLLAMVPHMHTRGKSFRILMDRKHETEILLDVPKYDFNWQHSYQLTNPISLNETMKLRCIAHFDNSKNNLVNPNPEITVRWGDQTWQEMVVAYFAIAIPVDSSNRNSGVAKQSPDDISNRVTQMVDRMMKRFDKNRNDMIERDELPNSFATFGFHRFDADGDEKISKSEARQQIRKTIRNRDRRNLQF